RLRGPCVPPLAELGIGAQAMRDAEIDAEPLRILGQHRTQRRLETLLDPDRDDAVVVVRRQLEEEILLGGEPVEDRAAGEPDLLLEPDHRRALVAVTPETPARAGQDVLPSSRFLFFRDLGHVRTYKTVRTYYYRCVTDASSSLLRRRPVAALLVAEVVSTTGSQMTWLALPWFVYRTTGSAARVT